jgi:uncharacterized protein YegL
MCSWLAGLVLFGNGWVCEEAGGPTALAAVFASLIVAISVVWAFQRAQGFVQWTGAALICLSAGFLSVAVGLPALQPEGSAPPGGRVVVLIDGSQSVRRTGTAKLNEARAGIAEHLRQLSSEARPDAPWRGSVWSFGAVPTLITPDAALADLPASVIGAEIGPLASDTNLEAAVSVALQDIAKGSGAGAILLLSDGLQTRGSVRKAARLAQQVGVPIHVWSIGSDSPALGLLSHDLGPDQALGRDAVLRATVQGEGVLHWGVNGEPEPSQQIIDVKTPAALRIPVMFAERGLNFMTLGFAASGQVARYEVAHTLVRGPARVLVYGTAPWVETVDPTTFLITRADPRDPVEPGTFDAVVIDALAPAAFAPDMPQRLLDAASGGVGLFIVNGPLRGTPEDMQRLSDWEDTALGPVLPVNSDPAEHVTQPPKRDILIIIDTSGSMGGDNIAVARAAANRIIDSVRPQDSLVIVPFSTDAGRPFEADRSPPERILEARRFVDRLVVAGGTNMTAAINRARQLRGNNCALFIIGDGGYESGQITGSPICFTTAIGVQGALLPGIDTNWGQQIPIRTARELGNMTFKVFTPEPRLFFWQDGPLQSIPVDEPSAFAMSIPVAGAALSYPRPESTDVSVMSVPPRAPILAFRQDPLQRSLVTGVFLGAVPVGLPAGKDGWASHVLSRLIGWDDPDLFGIEFQLNGEQVTLRVTFFGDGPVPPNIAATILLQDGGSVGLSMSPPDRYGIFEGTGRIGLSNDTSRGILQLEPSDGKTQLIPLRLPQRMALRPESVSGDEAFGFGVDSVLLTDIMFETGGLDLRQSWPGIAQSSTSLPRYPIWPWLAGLASVLFAMSLFCGGVRR